MQSQAHYALRRREYELEMVENVWPGTRLPTVTRQPDSTPY